MKKLVLLVIILLFPIFVNAKEYQIKDLTIYINDDNWAVFDRDGLQNNSQEYDLTKDEIEDILKVHKSNNVYLEAYNYNNENLLINIIVNPAKTVKEEDLKKKETIEDMKRYIKNNDMGLKVKEVSDIVINNHQFITYKYKNGKFNIIAYYTFLKNNNYIILFLNEKSTFSSSEIALVESIVDTIGTSDDKTTNQKNEVIKDISDKKKIPKYIKDAIVTAVIVAIVGTISLKYNKKDKKKRNSKKTRKYRKRITNK